MASSADPETLTIDDKKYRHVREGLASVLAPYAGEAKSSSSHLRNNDEGHQAVFYNPIQQFNRDLSVLAILVYGEGAMAEKQARPNSKVRPMRSRHARKKQRRSESDRHSDEKSANGADQPNARKRKADELEEEVPEIYGPDEITKRAKTAEVDNASDHHDIQPTTIPDPVAQENGEATDEPQNPVNGHVEEGHSKPPEKKQPTFSILDALSATGLRALRYAKEVPFATHIVANDLSSASVQNIDLNIKHNEVNAKVHSHLGDARSYMYSKIVEEHPRKQQQVGEAGHVHRFDVIDIDPYGTAAQFFDCSVQALQDGGMLCVTCTDAGVFASTGYPEKAFALYGGMPIKGPHSHEGGLRLILNAIAMSAAKYGMAVEPLLSLYIDYYARLFIRIHRKQHEVKLLAGTTMNVFGCGHGCGAWITQPLLRNIPQKAKNGDTFYKFSSAQAPSTTPNCEHCGTKTHLSGPMWAGPLHNSHFVQKMIERLPSLDRAVYGTVDRLEGMLTLALEEDLTLQNAPAATDQPEDQVKVEETGADTRIIPRLATTGPEMAPFFFMPTYLAKVIHCATPSEDAIRGAILGLGYKVSRSHCKPGSIKTNAPWTVLWEIMREFARTKAPIKEGAVRPGTPGWNILARTRGSERQSVTELKDAAKDQFGRCETKQDMTTVLQGLLWKLENEQSNTNAATNGLPKSGGEETNEANGEGETSNQTVGQLPALAPSTLQIVFDEKLGREKRAGRLLRYQMNPRAFWGPMNRAGSKA